MHLQYCKIGVTASLSCLVQLSLVSATNWFPSETWNVSPNATALVAVDGFRVDQPYPGTPLDASDPSSGGWSLRLNITESVNIPSRSDNPVSAIALQLQPPKPPHPAALYDAQTGNASIPRNISDSWRVRVVQFFIDDLPRTPGGKYMANHDDGNCDDVLTAECMDELKDRLGRSEMVLQADDTLGGIDNTTDTRQVHRDATSPLTDYCPMSGWAYVSYLDLTGRRYASMSTIIYQNPVNFTGKHQNQEVSYINAYEHYGARTFPVAFVWGHSNTTHQGEVVDREHITFACIRATESVNGSRLPFSAGIKMESPMLLVWVMSAVIGMVALA